MRDQIEARLADATARHAALLAAHDDLQRQAVAINAAGVENEQTRLGVEGEMRVLARLLADLPAARAQAEA